MSAAAFDPLKLMEEVFAQARLPPPATIATLRQKEPDCRNVAIVATPSAAEIESEALQEERAGLCAGSVAPVYLDAWARLNHRKPMRVSEAEWRLALDDGGRFLDAWGALAAEWGWTVGDLFDVPGSLVWFVAGAKVEAFGPEFAGLSDGRVFDRLAKDAPQSDRQFSPISAKTVAN